MLPQTAGRSFSVGICSTGNATTIATLLDTLKSDRFPKDLTLSRIVIAASRCTSKAVEVMKRKAENDKRILILEESERRGKAAAINEIMRHASGEFLVLVNSDALPQQGAIGKLLNLINSEDDIGIVSASPYFVHEGSLTSDLLYLMWSLHNDSSLSLNHAGLNNHASDELMIVNSRAIQRLPVGLVNDGAYLAGAAFMKGFAIRFTEEARVKIDVPSRLSDLIQQRRRILFGHFQVWRWLGQSPRTVELMLFRAPSLSLGLLVRRIARSPKLLRVLPLAALSEAMALLLAIKDVVTSTNRHTVWSRYGG